MCIINDMVEDHQLYHKYHFCNMPTTDDTTTGITDDDTDDGLTTDTI